MLDVRDPQQLIDDAWRSIGCRIRLPDEWSGFFDRSGRSPTVVVERRDYPRFYLRGKALLHFGQDTFCIYTKDMSRSGFCFLHHEQIFPCEKVSLYFPSGTMLEGTIVRCRRVGEDCFECGATVRQR